jgi:hypothetical protein
MLINGSMMFDWIQNEAVFLAACEHHFGMLKGQTQDQFVAEVSKLTPEDRKELIQYFGEELRRDSAKRNDAL